MAELVGGAVLGTAMTIAWESLKSVALSSARSRVFRFSKICSKLALDLEIYGPYFKLILDNIHPSASRQWEQDALVFEKTLLSGRKLLQDCQQLQELSGILHPLQRIRFGKDILRLRYEIKKFMQDNRLLILQNAQLEARLVQRFEECLARPEDEEEKEFREKLGENMGQVKEGMQRIEHGMEKNGAMIMSLMRRLEEEPLQENNMASSILPAVPPSSSSNFAAALPPLPLLPSLVVGLDEHVRQLRSMLLFGAQNNSNSKMVVILGGMGGIGKTTLALAVSNDQQVRDFFEERIYFINVSQNPDLVAVLSTIWTEVTGDKSLPRFQNPDDAYARLCWKLAHHMHELPPSSKCLLVLDDVWTMKSFQKLTFDIPGISTLVTTRQADKLKTSESQKTYQLQCLDHKNARRLFCYWAFNGEEDVPAWAIRRHVEEVISECKGLPLALTVIGVSLSSVAKVPHAWRRARDKLRQAEQLGEDQQDLLVGPLRTSVDALDQQLRECFMDLGAFPEDAHNPVDNLLDIWVHVRGMDRDHACCALMELASRCLLNLTQDRRRSLHGLTEETWDMSELRFSQHDVMRDIAIQLSRENAQMDQWTRLFMPQPEARVPKQWQSTRSFAKARVISMSCTEYKNSEGWPTLEFPNAEALLLYNVHNELPLFVRRMAKLKVLVVICNGRLRTAFQGLRNLQSFYIDAGDDGEIDISIDHRAGYGFLESMKASIQASWRYCLCSTVGISSANVEESASMPKIKKMMINGRSLEMNRDIANLTSSLEILKLSGSLPKMDLLKFDNLKVLDVGHLRNAYNICESKNLEVLQIRDCKVLRVLPTDIGQLWCLRKLVLCKAFELVELPKSIVQLRNLERMVLTECKILTHLPLDLGKLQCLRMLNLSGAHNLVELPESLVDLRHLEKLNLANCRSLRCLPFALGRLQCLKELNLMGAFNVQALPQSLVELRHLEMLNLSDCKCLRYLPSALSELQCLKELDLSGASKLEVLPESLVQLRHLGKLSLAYCRSLMHLPDGIQNMQSLKKLDMRGTLKVVVSDLISPHIRVLI